MSHTGKPNATLAQALVAFARLEQRRGPTVRELVVALGHVSTSNGVHWINRLAFAGLVQVVPGSAPDDARRWQLSDAGIAALAEAREKVLESA